MDKNQVVLSKQVTRFFESKTINKEEVAEIYRMLDTLEKYGLELNNIIPQSIKLVRKNKGRKIYELRVCIKNRHIRLLFAIYTEEIKVFEVKFIFLKKSNKIPTRIMNHIVKIFN